MPGKGTKIICGDFEAGQMAGIGVAGKGMPRTQALLRRQHRDARVSSAAASVETRKKLLGGQGSLDLGGEGFRLGIGVRYGWPRDE